MALQATQQQLLEETAAREKDRAKIEARLVRVLAQRKQLQQLLEESLRQVGGYKVDNYIESWKQN